MGTGTKAITDATFKAEVLDSSVPVLVDFWAEWCGPCKALGPKLEEIANELGGKLAVVKLNIDENPKTPEQFGIRSIPTMILFKNGQPVDQIVGNLPKDSIASTLKNHV